MPNTQPSSLPHRRNSRTLGVEREKDGLLIAMTRLDERSVKCGGQWPVMDGKQA